MRYVDVKITRDIQTVYNRAVPEWEIPVLEYIFDSGNVERLPTTQKIDREYPNPAEEFDRLSRAYGSDPKTDIPHVASVYGNAGAGVRALMKVIEEAKVFEVELDAEAAAPPVPKPAPRTPRRRAETDSLLA